MPTASAIEMLKLRTFSSTVSSDWSLETLVARVEAGMEISRGLPSLTAFLLDLQNIMLQRSQMSSTVIHIMLKKPTFFLLLLSFLSWSWNLFLSITLLSKAGRVFPHELSEKTLTVSMGSNHEFSCNIFDSIFQEPVFLRESKMVLDSSDQSNQEVANAECKITGTTFNITQADSWTLSKPDSVLNIYSFGQCLVVIYDDLSLDYLVISDLPLSVARAQHLGHPYGVKTGQTFQRVEILVSNDKKTVYLLFWSKKLRIMTL